jgi:IS1 family transposase
MVRSSARAGRPKDAVFLQRKALLELLSITRYYTDSWGAYRRPRKAGAHQPGPCNTEKIARKPLTLRTQITRLRCKTLRKQARLQYADGPAYVFACAIISLCAGASA